MIEPLPCMTCRFWTASGEQQGTPVGLCRRNPPQIVVVPEQDLKIGPNMEPVRTMTVNVQGRFPVMLASDWCGRHEPVDDRTLEQADG